MGATAKVEEARDRSQEALERAADSPWLEGLARAGLVARGLLYLVVALLAVQVARGHQDKEVDKQGAMQAVVHQPFGRVLVLGLAIGFGGYALWRFIEAAVGPSGERDPRKAFAKRVLCVARGFLYAGFCASAAKLLISSDQRGGNSSQADWTARVLGWPAGTWLIQAVGAGVIVIGLYQGWSGLTRKFRKRLKAGEMGPAERRWILGFGSVGMAARMVVSVLIGVFLVGAARHHDPGQAVGIDGALKTLPAHAYGPPALVVVAAGLAAYGVYSFAEARYRRLGPS